MDEHKTVPDPGVEDILNAEKECYELIDSMEFIKGIESAPSAKGSRYIMFLRNITIARAT